MKRANQESLSDKIIFNCEQHLTNLSNIKAK